MGRIEGTLAFFSGLVMVILVSVVSTHDLKARGSAVCTVGQPDIELGETREGKSAIQATALLLCSDHRELRYYNIGQKFSSFRPGETMVCDVVESRTYLLFGFPERLGIPDSQRILFRKDCKKA